MKKLFIAALALSIVPLCAAADEAKVWPNSDLKNYAEKLAPKVNADHFALEQLGDFGAHYVLMVYREASGPAEIHDTQTDFYVVQSGTATLHLGGTVVDAKTVEPGEVRGSSIEGGRTVKLSAGDTVNIPPKTPHHVVVAPGESITYMIVKVHAK